MTLRQGNRTLTDKQLGKIVDAFSYIKAEDDDLLAEHPESIFVYTDAFRKSRSKQKCLVVGRKGVGKSALAQTYLRLKTPEFAEAIPLQADRLMFDRVCNLLFAGEKTHRELNVSPDRVATTAWMRTLVLFAILQGSEWLLAHGRVADDRQHVLSEARRLVQQEFSPALGDPGADHNGRFHSLIERALAFLSERTRGLIDNSQDHAALRAEQIHQFFSPVPPKFSEPLAIIKQSEYRLLVTLDEFDDFVDSYMRDHPMAQRKQVLLDLFKGLVLAVKRLNSDPQLRWLHLMISVPEDKLMELWLRERAIVDTFTFQITWTSEELRECIERRLSHVLGTPTKWDDLFGFPIANKNPLIKAKEESFSYLVRHTHRKPRELMAYLRTLFESLGASGRPADERLFQRVVERTNERIVEEQFLPEYVPEYPTVERLLGRLRSARLQTVMKYEDLEHYLRNWKPWDDDEILNPAETLVRLFQMGVIGLREVCPRETGRTVRQLGAHVIYHFSFNGTSAQFFHGTVKDLERDGAGHPASGFQLVFSPLFFEYLQLRHEEPFIINQLA